LEATAGVSAGRDAGLPPGGGSEAEVDHFPAFSQSENNRVETDFE
jgi:hypothetical protein